MARTIESPQELLQRIIDGTLPENDVVTAVIRFGKERFAEAEGELARLLHSHNTNIRAFAIVSLVRDLGLRQYRKVAESMLLSDPDDFVRLHAIFALGSLGYSRREWSVLRPLYNALMNEEELPGIRVEAYKEIRIVTGRPQVQPIVRKFSDIPEWESIEELRKELDDPNSKVNQTEVAE